MASTSLSTRISRAPRATWLHTKRTAIYGLIAAVVWAVLSARVSFVGHDLVPVVAFTTAHLAGIVGQVLDLSAALVSGGAR